MGNFININTKMSWFFGKKKEEKKAPTPAEIAKQQQIDKERENYEIEKSLEKQQATLNKYEAKIADYARKVAEGQKEVKALLGAGQKDKAKRVLKNVKRYQGEITSIQGKCNMIEKQKMQIEAQKDDAGFFDTL